jgi:hypothetical protein
MAFNIEMTIRGVLEAGKFRTADELNNMTSDQKRNTLITVLDKYSTQDAKHYQACKDDDLIGKGAVLVFLREAGVRDETALKKMSDDNQRNTLIIELNEKLDTPIDELQGLTNQELVSKALDWYTKSKTVASISEFYWSIDNAKILDTAPDIIAQETYDNSGSSVPLVAKFSFQRDITNTSTFSQEQGYSVKVGEEITFKSGTPVLSSEEKISLEATTSNTWSFGESNSTMQRYTHESDVTVPPFKKQKRVATVTRGNLDVPYRALIIADDRSQKWIEGTWKGVSTVNLIESQADID